LAALGLLGSAAYYAECRDVGEEAHRILVPMVKNFAMHEFVTSGTAAHVAQKFDADIAGPRILKKYRVYSRQTTAGEEVVVQPWHLCFCRPTFILHDHAKEMKILGE
jgi:hypothetical protein